MSGPVNDDPVDWLTAELADTLNEDYELELSEPALALELRKTHKPSHPPLMTRAAYFLVLLTLQAELIKLQDWVTFNNEKIVVILEGRDAAGKGGVIKRITQRLNLRNVQLYIETRALLGVHIIGDDAERSYPHWIGGPIFQW